MDLIASSNVLLVLFENMSVAAGSTELAVVQWSSLVAMLSHICRPEQIANGSGEDPSVGASTSESLPSNHAVHSLRFETFLNVWQVVCCLRFLKQEEAIGSHHIIANERSPCLCLFQTLQ